MSPQTETIQNLQNQQALYQRSSITIHPSNSQQIKNNNSEKVNHHLPNKNESIPQSQTSINSKSFDYSLNENLSLHSYFSTDRIQDLYPLRTDSQLSSYYPQPSQQPLLLKANSISSESQFPLLMPVLIKSEVSEQSPQKQFLKHKGKQEFLQSEVQIKLTEDKIIQNTSSKQNHLKGRKSYTSYLHFVVDQNHLESPSHKFIIESEKNTEFFQFKLESAGNEIQKQENQPQDNNFDQKLSNPYYVPETLKCQPPIKPDIIKQNKKQDSKQSSDSSNQSPNHKSKHHRLQIRKIPSTLNEPYDELLLSINKDQKPLKKHPLDSPIKLKEKTNNLIRKSKELKQNQAQKSQQNYQQKRPHLISTKLIKSNQDEELLVNLPIVEGFCYISSESQDILETKFLLNKNQILFQNFKTLTINHITKMKFIEKDEGQICLKISYQPDTNKNPQNIIIKLLSPIAEVYFSQSYDFFAQIILRKLLLMRLYINEVNERIQNQSPNRSYPSSPVSSPTTLPSSLAGKVSENVSKQSSDAKVFSSQLFKKSALFNSWQKKYFVLTQKKLKCFAYTPEKEQKSKPASSLNKTSELWTRFELIYGYLVIKMWQSKIQKIQIGIPLCDFTNTKGNQNWLYGLSKFIVWKKN